VATNTTELYETSSLTPTGLVSITINPTNPTIAAGNAQHLTVTGTFSDNSTQILASVIWSSSSDGVATVTSDSTNLGGVYAIASGTTTVTACAGSVCGSTSVTVVVGQAPTITSANSATFTLGTAGSFTVTTTGSPTPSLTESGALPPGVMFHDNGNGSGTLSGTPTATGTFNITFTAQNGVSPNATQNLTVMVAGQAPAITSANSTMGTTAAQDSSQPTRPAGPRINPRSSSRISGSQSQGSTNSASPPTGTGTAILIGHAA